MFKVGIIGLGAIGQRLIKSFTEHPEMEITAVCDPLEELLNSTVAAIGKAKGFTDYKEMLKNADIDLVYVAVPPKFHHQIVTDCVLEQKHILCEKPLANSVEEAESLYKQAADAGIIHAMNFPLNYSSGNATFASYIKEGYIGKLRRLELKMHFPQWPRAWQQNNWVGSREQGGFVLEVGVHWIQQIQKIFGPVQLVHRSVSFPEDENLSENSILAVLELEDGTPVFINGMSQTAGKEVVKFTAYGTEGTLALEDWSELYGAKQGCDFEKLDESTPVSSLMNELVNALHHKEADLPDFYDGYQAQVVLESLRN
ncbi:Gfo/Idh/MocA family oxidoreductase [Niallia taxi]|uniref:Gfo/Idh/MocA family protein n=1 Tax=Niallia TaxID=2837506 RepID=UPI0030F9D128